ncbi:hypothetical protein PoB_002939700 [Plakobranchus ocellatus]|uniref:Uncharacterized protein n=1 Tax=Plakobranchus ocellatus TaxID=259542 RepID=A0AAV4A7R2_9GAST|nr:hypothetical protein PoB_002939700 [Plakobranchus ocellatus]
MFSQDAVLFLKIRNSTVKYKQLHAVKMKVISAAISYQDVAGGLELTTEGPLQISLAYVPYTPVEMDDNIKFTTGYGELRLRPPAKCKFQITLVSLEASDGTWNQPLYPGPNFYLPLLHFLLLIPSITTIISSSRSSLSSSSSSSATCSHSSYLSYSSTKSFLFLDKP